MKYSYECLNCNGKFEKTAKIDEVVLCPKCGIPADRKFHATSDVFIPSYFHTMKSDIFDYDDWRKLKKNPNIERLR